MPLFSGVFGSLILWESNSLVSQAQPVKKFFLVHNTTHTTPHTTTQNPCQWELRHIKENPVRNCGQDSFSLISGFSESRKYTVSSNQPVWLGLHVHSSSFTLQFGAKNGDQDLRFFNQFLCYVRKEKNIWPVSGNPSTLQMGSPNSSS